MAQPHGASRWEPGRRTAHVPFHHLEELEQVAPRITCFGVVDRGYLYHHCSVSWASRPASTALDQLALPGCQLGQPTAPVLLDAASQRYRITRRTCTATHSCALQPCIAAASVAVACPSYLGSTFVVRMHGCLMSQHAAPASSQTRPGCGALRWLIRRPQFEATHVVWSRAIIVVACLVMLVPDAVLAVYLAAASVMACIVMPWVAWPALLATFSVCERTARSGHSDCLACCSLRSIAV